MIWALFSIDNNYDQPEANLVAWWMGKPDIETVGKAVTGGFPCQIDEHTLAVVKIWGGEEQRVNETHFRLENIKPGMYERPKKGKSK